MDNNLNGNTTPSDHSSRQIVSPLADIFWTLVSISGAYLGAGMLITAERASLPGYAFAIGLLFSSITLFYLTWT